MSTSKKKNPQTPTSHPIGVQRRNGGDWVFRSAVAGRRASSFKRYSSAVESGVLNRDFDPQTRQDLRRLGIWETEY